MADLSITLPGYAQLVSASVALAIVLLGGFGAILAGRTIGQRLATLWERRVGARSERMATRMCALTRYLFAALVYAIALKADNWPFLSELILGFPMAAAAALFVGGFVRGLHISRWVALLLGGATFIALLADALNGLEPVTDVLDRIGFDAGKTRISLLGGIEIVVTILAIYAVLKLANRMLNQSIKRASQLDATQQLLIQKLGGVVLLVAGFFIGIDLLGIDLTALAVFSGAFGLAIGFGLQKTFGNLIAGIILLMDRSIKPGDVIVVGESVGHVSKIGVRAVSIITRDGKEHLIPNENLMTQEVENWSYSSPNVRVHIPVGVAYDCDLVRAQALMIEASLQSERVLKTPKPNVWLRAFGDNALEHDILVWIKDPAAGIGNVQSEILNRLWHLFKENNIEVPYAQRDIRIREWPGPPSA
ncbi:mechanosensitive ion channel family protein [Sphingomonas sp.]|uniref:mechanosensitive ion channel family protein n=1 Tax=Sphingomonas sp. TaxID=28214 RepID=UPI002FCBD75B